ncbi:MAG: permease, partial [Rhodobacter sp.]|nr:permease [Rhodobacter sp.]
MSTTSDPVDLSPYGAPAPIVRMFGWGMLGLLAAFFISNILIVGYDFPPLVTLFGDDARAWFLAAIYCLGIGLALAFVLRTPNRALRYDARKISNFNAYLIRGCFFAVLFIGAVDAIIAFVRVEGMLGTLFSENLAKELIRVTFIAPKIHFPLAVLGF